MDDLGSADGGQVAVTLIGKDDGARVGRAADAGGDGGRSAVGSLVHVAVEVVVGKDGAADRRNADGAVEDVHLVERLRHELMDDAVGTAGAVMQLGVRQAVGFLIYDCHVIPSPKPVLPRLRPRRAWEPRRRLCR